MANATFDKAKGAVKEALGDIAGNKDLEAEGKTDQAKGSAKQAVENVKDAARRAVADVKDAAAGKARDNARDAEERTKKH